MSEETKKVSEAIGHVVTADELVMDEATIIREQERMAKEKKRKKAAKRRKIIFSILGLLIVLAIVYFVWVRGLLFDQTAQETIQIVTEKNQSISYVKVDSINGNEMNVSILKANESEEVSNSQGQTEEGQRPDMGSMPGGFGSGNMPEGFDSDSMPGGFGSGNMPSGFDRSSMPEGFDMSNLPSSFGEGSGFGSGSDSGRSKSKSQSGSRSTANVLTYDGTSYFASKETETMQIPVGTEVTTKLGTKTTFSRISAGDCLALVTESIDGTDTIMAVYIVG